MKQGTLDRCSDHLCKICGEPSKYLVKKMFKGEAYVCEEHVLDA